MNESTVKKVFWAGLAFIVIIVAVSIYYNRGFVTYIKRNQITSVSTNQCSFSFYNSANRQVSIVINANQSNPALLDKLTPTSTIQIHAKSKKDITSSGEVKADVWVDGVKIGC